MVLWRAGRGDGLRRAVPGVRRAQRPGLACLGSEADHRDRTPRLHPFHRGLSRLLRRGLRFRGGPNRRAGSGTHQGRQAGPGPSDQQDRHLPRSLPAQQAQEHPRGAPLHPQLHPRADLQGRRPRHTVVVLLGRWGRAADREAGHHRPNRKHPTGAGPGTGGGHVGQRMRVVRATTGDGGSRRRHRGGRHHRTRRGVGRYRHRWTTRRVRIGGDADDHRHRSDVGRTPSSPTSKRSWTSRVRC